MKRLLSLRVLKILLWLLVPLLLWWALRQVSFRQVGATLSHLTVSQIATLVGLNLLIFLLFSGRWWLISRQQGYPVPFLKLVLYRLAAFGFSYYTPGPQLGGLPLQVHLLRKRHAVPAAAALANVTLDKLLDMSVNFTIMLAGIVLIFSHDIFPNYALSSIIFLSSIILLSSLLFLFPLAYMILLYRGIRPFSALKHALGTLRGRSKILDKLGAASLTTEAQVSQLLRSNLRLVIVSLGLSLLILSLSILEYYLTLKFLGLSLTIPQAFALLTIERLAFLTPMPAGIGALEAGQVLAISALGYDPALGISASLLIRARDLSLGAVGLWLAAILYSAPSTTQLPVNAGD